MNLLCRSPGFPNNNSITLYYPPLSSYSLFLPWLPYVWPDTHVMTHSNFFPLSPAISSHIHAYPTRTQCVLLPLFSRTHHRRPFCSPPAEPLTLYAAARSIFINLFFHPCYILFPHTRTILLYLILEAITRPPVILLPRREHLLTRGNRHSMAFLSPSPFRVSGGKPFSSSV